MTDETESNECPHGLGDPAWCTICTHKPEPVVHWHTNPFHTRFSGRCLDCDHVIHIDDMIRLRKVGERTIGAIHADCYEEE